jgi:O-antigen/teichoic acid export membrane protein
MGVVIRQSFKATIVSYIGAVFGYVNLVFLYPLCLPPELYGLTRVIVEAATIVAFFSQMGISNAIVRFFPLFDNEAQKHRGFLFYATMIPLVGFIVFGLVYIILQPIIVSYFGENSSLFAHYFYYILPLAFFVMYTTVCEAYSSVLMRIVVPKISREIILRIAIAIVVVAFYFKIINVDGLIIGFVFSYGIATLVTVFYILKIRKSSFKSDKSILTKENKKVVVPYLLYMLIAGLGNNVVSKIDTFMIASKSSLTETGIFSIAFFMAMIIELPSRNLVQILSPIASKAIIDNDMVQLKELYKKSSLNQMLFSVIIFIFIWINIHNVFAIMPHGEVYKSGMWVIFFIGLSKIFDASTGINVVIVGNSKFYYFGLFFIFFLAAISILLNNFLIPIYGITGAAIATAISILLYNTMFVWVVWMRFKMLPFSIATVKIVTMLVVALIINHFFLPDFKNPFIDGIIKSSIIMLILLGIIYFWKISLDFNQFLVKLLKLRKLKQIQKF